MIKTTQEIVCELIKADIIKFIFLRDKLPSKPWVSLDELEKLLDKLTYHETPVRELRKALFKEEPEVKKSMTIHDLKIDDDTLWNECIDKTNDVPSCLKLYNKEIRKKR